MKILIVDDSGTMRSIEKSILVELGVKDILEAADGLLALKAVIANKVDLILMDWNMPNLSGIDALKSLKANPASKSIPVIMVTSESEKSHILEAVRIGAVNYIVKPFSPSIVKEKLAQYMPEMPAAAEPAAASVDAAAASGNAAVPEKTDTAPPPGAPKA